MESSCNAWGNLDLWDFFLGCLGDETTLDYTYGCMDVCIVGVDVYLKECLHISKNTCIYKDIYIYISIHCQKCCM